jgi:hypothetical protein
MNHSEYLDLETTFEDLNKMLYYEEILDLTKVMMYHLSINNIKVDQMGSTQYGNIPQIFRKIYQEEQFTKYFKIAKMILRRDNITIMYLCIKAELIHIKSELVKLNSKYGSIENLQQIIDKELSIRPDTKLEKKDSDIPIAIPVFL